MIVDRYLIREIVKPLAGLCGTLVVIFVSYSAARYLSKAADGTITADIVLQLVFLKTLIALEVLLPISLYLSVVLGLGRLYADQEMTALNATGFSELRIARAVLKLALIVALVVGVLSLYGRPWAYHESYTLENLAESQFNLAKLKEGRFYEGALGGQTFFAERINQHRQRMEKVFIKTELSERTRIMVAEEAYQVGRTELGAPILKFLRGYVYELDRAGRKDNIVKFGEMTLRIDGYEGAPLGYKRKAASTLHLVDSSDPEDIAEFQWRLSTPIVALLLALLGIPISRTSPRQGKYAKMIVAVLIYAVYYNVNAMARSWLKNGVVGPFPGLWWTVALLALALVLLLQQPVWRFWLHRLRPATAG